MCVLRAFGEAFDPTAFLRDSSLVAYSTYERGKRRAESHETLNDTSGLKVEVSAAEWTDVPAQCQDALQFLLAHHEELRRLVGSPGVEAVVLDFPVQAGELATFVRVPRDLAARSSSLGIELEFSVYPAPRDSPEVAVVGAGSGVA